MKTRMQLRFIALISLAIQVLFLGNVHSESSTSAAMVSCLSQEDLVEFMRKAKRQEWKAPYIFSRWHEDKIAPSENRNEQLAARMFGRLLADRLDQFAKQVRQPEAANEDYESACALLDLADWIVAPAGYGNIALFQRAQDIATVPLSRLIIDLQFPMAKIQEQVVRLRRGAIDPIVLTAMLNAESGVSLVTPEMASNRDKSFLYGRIAKKIRSGQDPKGLDPLIKQKILASPVAKLADLDLFVDDNADSVRGVFTLSRMWDGKWHESVGNGSTNAYNLPYLAEFRQAIGYFPETKEGFRRAWDEVSNSSNRAHYGPAWLVYSLIQNGRFLDHDSLAEEDDARQQKVIQETLEHYRRSNPSSSQRQAIVKNAFR